jgi:hypothetical protein
MYFTLFNLRAVHPSNEFVAWTHRKVLQFISLCLCSLISVIASNKALAICPHQDDERFVIDSNTISKSDQENHISDRKSKTALTCSDNQ